MAKLIGIGHVLKEGQELATVSYSLKTIVHHVTGMPGVALNSIHGTTGVLRVLQGKIPAMSADDDPMTLRLQDETEGRFQVISIEDIGLSYGIYRISISADEEA